MSARALALANAANAAPWRTYLRVGVAGLVGACAFPLVLPGLSQQPVLEWAPRELAILVCAASLFQIASGPQAWRRKCVHSVLCGVGFFSLLTYWVHIAMVVYGGMSPWVAGAVTALLVLYCALHWALVPLGYACLQRGLCLPPAVAFATSVVVVEWVRGTGVMGFPWGLWGYSQARNLGLLQLASLAGVYGVSWLVALVGALVALGWQQRRARAGKRAWVGALALVVAAHGAGWLLLRWRAAAPGAQPVQVALLQGSIAQQIKNESQRHSSGILTLYAALARQAKAGGAEVVIWPEAAWPSYLSTQRQHLEGVEPLGLPQLIGAGTYTPATAPAAEEPQLHNSAVWVLPDNRLAGRYDKMHLVPFGEFVPLRALLPVGKVVPDLLDYTPGKEARPLGEPAFGVLICYDGVFPEIAREQVRLGARLLANLTNDAWYGISSAPFQHRDFYRFRAVETDRWVARAANSGLSMFIDPQGRLHRETGLGAVAVAQAALEPRDSRTLYVRWGNWWVYGCLAAFALAAVNCLRRLKRAPAPR